MAGTRRMYSIIYQFTGHAGAEHVCYKRYQKRTLFIITDQPEAVYKEMHAQQHAPRGHALSRHRACMSKRSAPWCIPWCRRTRCRARALPRARGGFPRLHQLPQDRFARRPLLPQAQRLAPSRGFCRVRAPFAESEWRRLCALWAGFRRLPVKLMRLKIS